MKSNAYSYESRLLYENILSEALKRIYKERIDNPELHYIRAVKAFSMLMPRKIKAEHIKHKEKVLNDVVNDLRLQYNSHLITKGKMETKIADITLEFLLWRMETKQLLIPEKGVKTGGGYR